MEPPERLPRCGACALRVVRSAVLLHDPRRLPLRLNGPLPNPANFSDGVLCTPASLHEQQCGHSIRAYPSASAVNHDVSTIVQKTVETGRKPRPMFHGLKARHTYVRDREMMPFESASLRVPTQVRNTQSLEFMIFQQSDHCYCPPCHHLVKVGVQVSVPGKPQDTLTRLSRAEGQSETAVSNREVVDPEGGDSLVRIMGQMAGLGVNAGSRGQNGGTEQGAWCGVAPPWRQGSTPVPLKWPTHPMLELERGNANPWLVAIRRSGPYAPPGVERMVEARCQMPLLLEIPRRQRFFVSRGRWS